MTISSIDRTGHKPTITMKPHPHDVLCGRGGQSNNHPGNEWFRRLVRSNRALYRSCPKHTKLLVAKAIVQAIQQQDPPGKFIKIRDSDESHGHSQSEWESISYSQAVNKTSQALREKESRDGRKRKKQQKHEQQQQQQQQTQHESLPELNETQKLNIANEARKRARIEGGMKLDAIDILTTVTIQSAKSSENTNSFHQPPENTTTSSREQQAPQKLPQRPEKKRKKNSSSSTKSWWHMRSSWNATGTVGNTAENGTQKTALDLYNENGNRRMKGARNVKEEESNKMGGHEITNMGRGAVFQVMNFASSMQTPPDAATPLPMETTLDSRQSTLFRFLNTTNLFGREASIVPAQPEGATNPSSGVGDASFDVGNTVDRTRLQDEELSQNPLQSTSWPLSQQTEPDVFHNSEIHHNHISSAQHMGKTSVQGLRLQHLKDQQNLLASGLENEIKPTTSIAGLEEEEMEEMPISGLMMRKEGEGQDVPPSPKGLKTQISDWLTSFFPSNKRDESPENVYHTDENEFGTSSRSGIETGEAAIPPPPTGESSLGRSVSSAIYGLVESPSLFLSTLKSGVSSVFGDAATGEPFSSPIRRFPSAFQHQQRRQQHQNFPQQPGGGKDAGGGILLGNHPVLGERTERPASLLDDFDETPMEKELRNAKSGENPVGLRAFFGGGKHCMPFK